MQKQFLKILILLSVSLFFEKCAQVAPLTGGVKDTKPPKLMESLPANGSGNFNSAVVILKFNEFVQLKDLKNELIISPKLKTEPEITTDGKKIRIELNKDELLPNTTYRIYFGKSVADMTESNAIPNFEYVFSTGAFIDTLKIKGIVTEAFTKKTAKDVVVGLYVDAKNKDSLAYKQTPDYVSRSNDNGEFSFSHLPPKTFKVIAFYDKIKNNVYDGEIEKIAFIDDELVLQNDSSVDLKLFQELPNKAFLKKVTFPYPGKAYAIYNKRSVFKVKAAQTENNAHLYESDINKEKDTVNLYYSGITDSLHLFITNLNTKKTDTINVAVPKTKPGKNKTLNLTSNIQNSVLDLNSTLQFTFLTLQDSVKTDWSKFHFYVEKDSLFVSEPAKHSYITPYRLELTNKILPGVNYKVKIDTACFFDQNGKYNDSLKLSFKTQNKTDFGKVTIKLLLNKKQAYIVQLINSKDKVVKEDRISFSLSSSNATSIDFTDVTPGTYLVKILFDDNNNTKWDTGNYLLNKQPEKVFISSKQIKVMADWEIEEEILVK